MADDEENENIKLTGNESMKQSSSLQKMLESITKERSKPSFSISGGIRPLYTFNNINTHSFLHFNFLDVNS